MPKQRVHVAVGVIRQGDHVLLAERPAHVHQGGLWEFPGGKVEPGESVQAALVRELHEELGIVVDPAQLRPLIRIHHDYDDKAVLLDVHELWQFAGEPEGRQAQPVFWQSIHALPDQRFPAANRPIIRAVQLPDRCLVTGAYPNPEAVPLMLAHTLHRYALSHVILRCPDLPASSYRELATACLAITREHRANLILHDHPELVAELGADGVHLSQRVARRLRRRPLSPHHWVSVSCHDAAELEAAQQLGADAVLLSPVLPTQSHPDVPTLGWEAFAGLCEQAKVPVWAMGGLDDTSLARARQAGAQGIAAIRAWWPSAW